MKEGGDDDDDYGGGGGGGDGDGDVGRGERGEVLLMGQGGAKGPPKGRREGDALVPMRSKGDGEVEWGGCD